MAGTRYSIHVVRWRQKIGLYAAENFAILQILAHSAGFAPGDAALRAARQVIGTSHARSASLASSSPAAFPPAVMAAQCVRAMRTGADLPH